MNTFTARRAALEAAAAKTTAALEALKIAAWVLRTSERRENTSARKWFVVASKVGQ